MEGKDVIDNVPAGPAADRCLSRRAFLRAASAVVSGASLACSACRLQSNANDEAKRLNVYNWSDYIHPDVVPEFERRYGVHVNYDTFASNDVLLSKMQAGGADYDIIVPSNYVLGQLSQLRLLKPIEHERLPNLSHLMPRFTSPSADRKLHFSVPYMWGTTGLGYNSQVLKERLGLSPGEIERQAQLGWDVFWDERLAGRITLLDDERETLGMSLKRLGFSYNSRNFPEIAQAKEQLLLQKPLLMSYTVDQVIIQLASGDSWLALAYSGDVQQAIRTNRAVKYAIPQQGTSVWIDSFSIPASAPHVENAYLWINYMLEPEVAMKNAEYTGYATPNRLALALLDPRVKSDNCRYPSDEILDRSEQIAGVGQAALYYDKLWTELKCA
jgi:spermidine/putrescine transport system substrate-binding protein